MSLDLMSNMLSSIKNASLVGNKSIEIPFSKECESVAKVLKEEGYIKDVKSFKPKGKSYKKLHIDLAYTEDDMPLITEIKRVSKPGRRVYKKSDEVGKILSGFGIMVVSTSRGVVSGSEARKKKLGGEVVCKVW